MKTSLLFRKEWEDDAAAHRKRGWLLCMNPENMENYKKLEALFDPCDQYSTRWDAGPMEEAAAKQALVDFFEGYKDLKTDKDLKFTFPNDYYSFYIWLLPVQKALAKGKYTLACNEMVDLLHFEYCLQKRIYTSLMILYRKYLQDSAEETSAS